MKYTDALSNKWHRIKHLSGLYEFFDLNHLQKTILIRYDQPYQNTMVDPGSCYLVVEQKVLCFTKGFIREVDLKTEKSRIIEEYWTVTGVPIIFRTEDDQVLMFSSDFYFGDNNNAVQAFDLARYKRDLKNNKVKFIRDY
jgi:hypothetical protein